MRFRTQLMCICFICRRVPKLPWRWKTAKWLTEQHRQNTWGQRWDRHRENTHRSLFLTLSDRNDALSAEKCLYVRTPESIRLHVSKWSSILTKILSPFFSILLICCPTCGNASCAEPQTPSLNLSVFFLPPLQSIFPHWTKALIHPTLSIYVALQWHSYYSPLFAPIPTMQRMGAVLHPTCLSVQCPLVDLASLAPLGADSMGTPQT